VHYRAKNSNSKKKAGKSPEVSPREEGKIHPNKRAQKNKGALNIIVPSQPCKNAGWGEY